jgi:hypothetical protein
MHLTRILTTVSLLFFLPLCALSQDKTGAKSADAGSKQAAEQPTKTGDSANARAEFDRVYGEWKEMMARLAELNGKYQTAGEAEKAQIEKEYNGEAARGMKLAESLKKATEAAFAADPKDKEVSDLLSVMARSAFVEDNYEEVKRFAGLL